MSNIQDLKHIDQTKIAQTIKFLKNEIVNGPVVTETDTSKSSTNCYCKNELTGVAYPFLKGSTEERDLYRVMPVDGLEKIYFDSKDEYTTWSRKNKKNRKLFV